MTYEQYWDKDCTLVKAYRDAHRQKQQWRNQELWLQGFYFYEAMCNVAPVLCAFPKKGAKPVPYLAEPYALTAKEQRERKEREEKAKYDKMKSKMQSWAKRTNQVKATQHKEVVQLER